MNESKLILIADMIASPLAVSTEDGQKIHDAVAAEIRVGGKVSLSFRGIQTLISAFLNSAVGQLYGEFSDEEIRNCLSIQEMEPDDAVMLKRVIDNAKLYFSHRESFDQAWKEEVNDEE